MRHRKRRGRLGRPKGARNACVRNTVANLLTFERITTTVAKAKEARRIAEKLITLAKVGDLSAQRQASSLLGQNRELTHSLFKEIAPRFKDRHGGYTRIIRKGRRSGDNASLVILELTEQRKEKKPPHPKVAKKEEPKVEPEKEKKETVAEKLGLAKRRPKVIKKKPKEKFFRRIFKRERDSL